MKMPVGDMKMSAGDILWTILIVILVVSSVDLLCMIYVSEFVYGINLQHGVDSTDKGLNLLAAVYYISGTLVAITASLSIISAKNQIRYAEESRMASVYIDLDKRYNEDKIQCSLHFISGLRAKYESEKAEDEALEDFAHKRLLQLRQEHVIAIQSDPSKSSEYTKYIHYLELLEYLGVLVNKKYLRGHDLFNLIGRDIVMAEDVMKAHIKWIRDNYKDKRLFANAIMLMEMTKNARNKLLLTSYNKGYYMMSE